MVVVINESRVCAVCGVEVVVTVDDSVLIGGGARVVIEESGDACGLAAGSSGVLNDLDGDGLIDDRWIVDGRIGVGNAEVRGEVSCRRAGAGITISVSDGVFAFNENRACREGKGIPLA